MQYAGVVDMLQRVVHVDEISNEGCSSGLQFGSAFWASTRSYCMSLTGLNTGAEI